MPDDPLEPVEAPDIDVDVRDAAATAHYPSTKPGKEPKPWHGQVKRTYKQPRAVDQIRGITLHQVAVNNVGVGAYRKMTAHLAVHHNGNVYWIHPFETYLLHGHRFNRDTVGIEVAGAFEIQTPLPEVQVEGIRRAIRFALAELERMGGHLAEIWAHRQASSSRTRCPSRAIYQAGCLWAVDALGMSHDPNHTRGSGLVIPASWKDELPASLPVTSVLAELSTENELDCAFVDDESEADR